MLSEWIGKHEGETAWIFGKGPSVDQFDMAAAGPLRIALNDVCRIVPNCIYVFANDGIQKWKDKLSPGLVLFQPERAIQEFDSTINPPCRVVPYCYDYQPRITTDRRKFAECIEVRAGSLCSAIQILWIMGVSKINLVGIDGTGDHSAKCQWSNRIRTDSRKTYSEIRDAGILTAKQLGIPITFFNGNQPTTDGTMKITLTKNTFIGGVPYSNGQTAEIPEGEARRLIAQRLATPVDDSPAPIETAEAPMQARESAMVKTAKKKF